MEELKPCPNCGCHDLTDAYVYIRCGNCGMTGPKMNKGKNDDHADFVDHQRAIEKWNALPRHYENQSFENEVILIDWRNNIVTKEKRSDTIDIIEKKIREGMKSGDFAIYDAEIDAVYKPEVSLKITLR